MAVKSKAEILEALKGRMGEELDDESIAFLEDVTDTLDDYDTKIADKEDWKTKYEENDKEWRKKYNTGLPSCVPYVVKDETYKDISVKRKHLYNRKNKIKMHKRLTDEEKQEKMAAIDEELALLKAKLKYLNRVEAVKEYKKNQKEELEKLASEPLD